MVDPANNEKDLEAYLQGKSALSALYKSSTAQEPDAATDKAILEAARQSVEQSATGSPGKGKRWYIPTALAASILVGVALVKLFPISFEDIPAKLVKTQPEAESGVYSAANPATPEHMLEQIVTLLKKHELEQAQEQYQLFRTLFTDYQIDYKKYPELKQLKK